MQVNFLASLVGLIISCVCFLVSQVVFSFTTQFYHEDKSSLKWVPHFIVFIASFVSLVFLYSSQVSTQNFAKGVLTVFIMGLIAYTDIGIDRIPIRLLVAGFIAGIFLGLLTEDLTCYLIGGFVTL